VGAGGTSFGGVAGRVVVGTGGDVDGGAVGTDGGGGVTADVCAVEQPARLSARSRTGTRT